MDLLKCFIRIYMFCCYSFKVICDDSSQENETDEGGSLCNVAYRRQTTSSSVYTENDVVIAGYSCNGVDGSTSQNYFNGSCVHTQKEANPWWEVDLGVKYNVQYVTIYVRTDNHDFNHYTKADNINIYLDESECNRYDGPTTVDKDQIRVNCSNGGVLGRVLRITRNVDSGYLVFCEIQVYATVDDTTCPEPTVPWYCGNVSTAQETTTVTTDSFISTKTSSTTGNHAIENPSDATQTPVISTTTSSTTENQNDATQTPIISTTRSPTTGNHVTEISKDATQTPEEPSDCLCPCSTLGSNVLMNLTMDEILAKLDEILDDIKVDPKKTSVAIRKRTSAKDNRPSAQTVGYVGMAVLIGIGAGIILLDIDTFIRFLRQIISSRRR